MNEHIDAVLNGMDDDLKAATPEGKKAIPPLLLLFLKAALVKFGPIILAWLEEWLNREKDKAQAEAAGVT